MGISTLFEGASLTMIVPVVDRVFNNKPIILPQGVEVPAWVEKIVGRLNQLTPLEVLQLIMLTMGIIFLLKGLFLFLQSYLMNVVGQKCVMDVRNQIYHKLQELPLGYYGSKRTGELISRITNDVTLITHAISYGLTDLIYQSMKIIFFSALILSIYWRLALISFIIFPVVIFPVVKIGKKIKKYSLETQKRMADLNSILTETIQGVHIVKAFCREEYEFNRFKEINYQYFKYIIKSIKRMVLVSPLTELITSYAGLIILFIFGKKVIRGELSFGMFGLFMGALMSMVKPFKKLSNVHSINQQALAGSRRIYEILEEKPNIVEKPNAYPIKEFNKEIVFENIWFKYQENEDFVLKNINLRVKKNEIIALVGHSGAGKSTLVSLLPRFYDPQRGRVTIDGWDLRDLKIKALRNLISLVSQEMVLFNSTIWENIAYGKERASRREIIEAAKKAFAYDFIMKLPNGFDTIVGDRGFRLSGGEKQRLAIARAILKDAPILILDEATSQLDSVSEQFIQQALNNLMKGKTVFVIAHRLSTVQNADKIVVLDKGEIVEVGKHQELIANGKVYQRLYQLQFNV